MFETYDQVEYNGDPARIVNKNSEICYLIVLEDTNLPSQNTKRIKASNLDLKALDVTQFASYQVEELRLKLSKRIQKIKDKRNDRTTKGLQVQIISK